MTVKKYGSFILRKAGLLELADYIKFIISLLKNSKTNRKFVKANPGVSLPPDFILFESFGKLNYHAYYYKGKETAAGLFNIIEEYADIKSLKVLEWGCGPARVLRHLPDLYPDSEFYGSDYNDKTISWCRKNINNVSFEINHLEPPFRFEDDTFDVIYSVSVFTHLDSENQIKWFDECMRVLKNRGLFLFTTHGDSATDRLLASEKKLYVSEGYYIRSNVTEGKRNFTSYNTEKYIRDSFKKHASFVEFIPGKKNEQDIWLVRKQEKINDK
ncbi:MAG: class I SAM-dependent methyltransferase [Candidatus Delongbacteria bacterium]